eukprot:8145628-Ditylum_brightwellii.AAC.1
MEWRQVETPEEIVQYPMIHNQHKFSQVCVQPFTVPILSHADDWGEISIQLDLICQGKYKNEELNTL